MSPKKKEKTPDDEGTEGGVIGILTGLADLVQKLGDLAEKGKDLAGTGELEGLGSEKKMKAIYGFNVKMGLGKDREVKVEPFGNIKKDKESGKTVVQEVREPMVDVFEEDDHVLIVAELPGVGLKDIDVKVKDDVLSIKAEKGDKKYYKEVLLPEAFSREKVNVTCNNGMLEIKCIR